MERFLDVLQGIPSARQALCCDGAQGISYGALVARARALGAVLAARGVGPGDRVALELPRGAEFVIGVLGVWWAGAAFFPLDPALPAERRALLLEDAAPRCVLDALPEVREAPACAAYAARPEDPAYLIYTSGSTGRPKGVLVPHRGLVSLLRHQVDAFGMSGESRALWYLSPNFDASLSDIGTTLLSGAALCIERVLPAPLALPALLAARGVTHLDLPPAVLGMLRPEDLPPCLETLIVGGEPSPPERLRRFAQRLRVVNVYGPTEATICASLCRCDAQRWDRPLLGQPVPGVTFQVDDEGELLIGGVGLALGYLGQPELTAQRFVVVNGERLYRSGDRVRRCKDGELQFLGRTDRQVKLRGLRLEPEEIEAELLRHPLVRRAAVVLRELAGRRALVAFVEAAGTLSAAGLRRYLLGRLPAWMLPQRVVLLDALPLSSTGKVDLPVLQRWELRHSDAAPPLPPRDGREALVLALFQQVLGVTAGIEDDFFELGGDSLTVLELLAAAAARGLPLDATALSRHRTAAALAAHWDDAADSMSTVALREDARPALLAPAAGIAVQPPRRVLLTGATGFLGACLLAELLGRTQAEVVCLARTPPTEPAGRVRWLRGDLAAPRLDLDEATWTELTDTVDAVYHCGALVNLVLPYALLRPTNVGGTERLLQLCAERRRKPLHYISSLSVLVASDADQGVLREDADLSGSARVYGGYAQSKWAAEWLLRRSGYAPLHIYRLGLIVDDLAGGPRPQSDQLALFLRGLRALRAVPQGSEGLRLDFTPVSFAAAAVVELSREEEAGVATYHIANPQPLTLGTLLGALQRHGVTVEMVAPESWPARLRPDATVEEATAYLALSRHRALDLFPATGAIFEQQRGAARLRKAGLRCPAPDDALLDICLGVLLSEVS